MYLHNCINCLTLSEQCAISVAKKVFFYHSSITKVNAVFWVHYKKRFPFQMTELSSLSKYKMCLSEQVLKKKIIQKLCIASNGQVCKMGKLTLWEITIRVILLVHAFWRTLSTMTVLVPIIVFLAWVLLWWAWKTTTSQYVNNLFSLLARSLISQFTTIDFPHPYHCG